MQIVLAKLVRDIVVTDPGAPDLGRRAKVKEVLRPVALMWLANGTDDDLRKACHYASVEGYTVYTFDCTENDPLGRAKRSVEAGLSSGDALHQHKQTREFSGQSLRPSNGIAGPLRFLGFSPEFRIFSVRVSHSLFC